MVVELLFSSAWSTTAIAIISVVSMIYVLVTSSQNSGSKRKDGRRVRFMNEGTEQFSENTTTIDDEAEERTVEGDTKEMEEEEAKFVEYHNRLSFSESEMIRRSADFYELMNRRRTVRMFSNKSVPVSVVENILKTAGTGPSGAHCEPWTFVAVMNDTDLKAEIRHIVEMEEKINYERRMGQAWVSALRVLNTEWSKPYLETAPCILFVFMQTHGYRDDGSRKSHYYYQISTAISVGILLTAIHNAGLVTVTTTPMNAEPTLRALLERPSNEKLLVLLPIGYAADDVTVPDLHRKSLDQIAIFK